MMSQGRFEMPNTAKSKGWLLVLLPGYDIRQKCYKAQRCMTFPPVQDICTLPLADSEEATSLEA
jgi:hypothetical protein